MKHYMHVRSRRGPTLIASCALTLSAVADPYNLEFGLSYETATSDVEEVRLNEDNFALEGTYYFQTVDTTNRALNEAAFLSRSSYLSGAIDVREVDDNLDNIIDTEGYSVEGKFINRDTGWYGRANYINTDPDYDTVRGVGSAIVSVAPEFSGFALAAGRYIFENTTVELGYTEVDFDDHSLFDNAFSGSNDTVGVGIKHVGPITDSVGFSIEANYYWVDVQVADFDNLDDDPFDSSGDVYSVSALIYPLYNLGIGLTYADADDLRGLPYLTSTSAVSDGLGLIVDWFVTDSIGLRATYNNREYDLSDGWDINDPGEVDRDSLILAARVRF